MVERRATPNIKAADISAESATNRIHEGLGLDDAVAHGQCFNAHTHGSFARQLLREDPCREGSCAPHWVFKRINPLSFILESEGLT